MANDKYLVEAFQKLSELNEDVFDLTPEGAVKLHDFVADDIADTENIEEIIDPLATTEEDLKDSYIGKVILDCTICQSKIYKDAADVVLDEAGKFANVGEACPYCQSTDGFKVIGQVAPYSKTDIDVEVTTKSEDLNGVTEGLDKFKAFEKEANKYEREVDTSLGSNTGLVSAEADVEHIAKKYFSADAIRKAKAKNPEFFSLLYQAPCDMVDELKKSLSEDLNGVTVDTDKETINITATEKTEDGEQMIVPVEPEVSASFDDSAVEPDEDSEADFDIDTFEPSEFDGLGESYLKRVYENVDSFKTTSSKIDGNFIKLEGIIGFKSGKKAKTNFTFESRLATKTGKLKFFGENAQFAKSKNAFILTGKLDGKKLIAESLTYNYKVKDGTQSQRLYGRVCK